MLKKIVLAVAVVMAGSVAGQAAELFSLTSSSFKEGAYLPKKHSNNSKGNPNCVGDNVSPQLSWANAPAGTTSFALIVFDPDARNGLGVDQWIAYGIPASMTAFAEGETSQASDKYVGGKGTAGVGTYQGPCTPAGPPHHYIFTLIATDLDAKALPAGLTKAELLAKLNGHAKGATSLLGMFKNPL